MGKKLPDLHEKQTKQTTRRANLQINLSDNGMESGRGKREANSEISLVREHSLIFSHL